MAVDKRKFRPDPATGFGSLGSKSGERFYRKDGTVNIVRRGVGFFNQLSWYHTMLSMPRWKFYLTLWLAFLVVNLFFSSIYFIIGVEHLGGIQTGSPYKNFAEAFLECCTWKSSRSD